MSSVASPAASPATTGATTAGNRIFETMTEKLTPEVPAPISTAPMSPPNKACDELEGSPNSHVTRFHKIAPTSPAKIITGVTTASLTMPPEIVLATSVDRNAPTTFSTAAITTAVRGRRAPVATDVAIALALSWNPLVKSNTSAVRITNATTNNVVVMQVFLSGTAGAGVELTDPDQRIGTAVELAPGHSSSATSQRPRH